MNPFVSLAVFMLSMAAALQAPRLRLNQYSVVILCFSLAWLWFDGPNAPGFGLSLGSGWVVLNQAVDRLSPLD